MLCLGYCMLVHIAFMSWTLSPPPPAKNYSLPPPTCIPMLLLSSSF